MPFVRLDSIDIAGARLAAPEGPITIYALCDPRDATVRYIGKTWNEVARLAAHLEANQSNLGLRTWVRDLLAAKLEPVMWPLQHVTHAWWEATERHWIRFFRLIGMVYNIEAGGERRAVVVKRPKLPPTPENAAKRQARADRRKAKKVRKKLSARLAAASKRQTTKRGG